MSAERSCPRTSGRRFFGGCGVGVLCVALVGLAGVPAFGQLPLYSIDFQGPTIGAPDAFLGFPISEGDLLFPFTGIPFGPGPFPAGGMFYAAGIGTPAFADLGIPVYAPGASFPGVPGFVEVDAVSFGLDFPLDPVFPPHEFLWSFSVDEFAVGGLFIGAVPEVFTEGAFGALEASADVYVSFPPGVFPPFPAPPFGAGPGNTMLFDGDGLGPVSILPVPPFATHGGLFEPDPPFVGLPDIGDNLDALDMDDLGAFFFAPTYPVYFSLDGPFPDPYYGVVPPNSASAGINGFVGGDVLVTFGPGGPPAIFAPAFILGLDIFGPDTDDIDALVLAENGSGVYEQSAVDFDWVGGATDMLLFSVRRDSLLTVFGVPDSRFGIPISESDILTPPPFGAPFGTPPGIWMAGENLGLATVRSGFPTVGLDDDLDALDLSRDCLGAGMPDIFSILYGLDGDCDGNFFPDTCDVIYGAPDCNGNFVPDSCEPNSAFADLDMDGDVDGPDFLTFAVCFNGSLSPPTPACANLCADIDHDGDVDGVDFLTFAVCFNGSLKPPSPC